VGLNRHKLAESGYISLSLMFLLLFGSRLLFEMAWFIGGLAFIAS